MQKPSVFYQPHLYSAVQHLHLQLSLTTVGIFWLKYKTLKKESNKILETRAMVDENSALISRELIIFKIFK